MKFGTFLLSIAVLAAGSVNAEQIEPSCLTSFDVKDRVFATENQSISCELVEQSRTNMFLQLEAIESSTDLELQAEINAWEQQYEAALAAAGDGGDYGTAAKFVVNNSMATIGLIACVETAGAGCALAAVAFVWGKYTAIDGLVEAQEAREELRKLRKKVDGLRKVALQGKDLKAARDRVISDFNSMCATVKQNCL
ncbi:MAG: hypothetical protein ACFHX7_12380 [Pseudomonadota bacterium]